MTCNNTIEPVDRSSSFLLIYIYIKIPLSFCASLSHFLFLPPFLSFVRPVLKKRNEEEEEGKKDGGLPPEEEEEASRVKEKRKESN